MRVAVFGKQFGQEVIPYIEELFSKLFENGIDVVVYRPYLDFLSANLQLSFHDKTFTNSEDLKGVDVFLSIGGDGTILEAITIVRDTEIPILGINTGRLGFLANVAKKDINMAIQDLLSNRFDIDERALIQMDTEEGLFGDLNFGLNEFTVTHKESTAMITIHTFINGKLLNSYWADGIIISTPTGSTGYSLSCGGPIVMPGSQNFIITPIAPHNLNVRPFVIPDNNEITIRVEGRSSNFMVSLDSRSETMSREMEIRLKKAPFTVKLVRTASQDFANTLRNKLLWGLDRRN